jgi:predicted DCC family thiol-disulfide oxidoreductase YuxK
MQKNWEFEVFYDGDCPLCRREIEWLKKKNLAGRVSFRDISHPDFDAEGETGKTFPELMARLHGRRPNGDWVTGVESLRLMYKALGYRRLVQLSRWPIVRNVLDSFYAVFAVLRLKLNGKGRYLECVECGRAANDSGHPSREMTTPAHNR